MIDSNPSHIASVELGRLSLGDRRLDRRAVRVLEGMLKRPTASVASQQPGPGEAVASYRFLENDAVSPDALLNAHIAATVERCQKCTVVLAIQDTMVASLPGLVAATGLGPVNDSEGSRGYFLHSALMVDAATHTVLGLGSEEVWVRSSVAHPRAETSVERRKRARESEHWGRGQENVARAFGRTQMATGWSAPIRPTPRIVAVFDREGDIFEAFETCRTLGHGYVIRAMCNRLVEDERGPRQRRSRAGAVPTDAPPRYSIDEAKAGVVLGSLTVEVPRSRTLPARIAVVEVRATLTELAPPKSRGRRGDTVTLTQVHVEETSPPEGVEPLRWWLLTSELVFGLEDAARIVDIYRARWLIEEFHMGLKTGLGIERRQFESFEVHSRFLSMASIVAWAGLALRDAARQPGVRLAGAVLTTAQLAVLSRLVPRLGRNPTARDVLRAVAKLGGFMGRKCDGEPGWRTLTRGLQQLYAMEAGFLMGVSSVDTA